MYSNAIDLESLGLYVYSICNNCLLFRFLSFTLMKIKRIDNFLKQLSFLYQFSRVNYRLPRIRRRISKKAAKILQLKINLCNKYTYSDLRYS